MAIEEQATVRVGLTLTTAAVVVRVTGDVDLEVVGDLRAALDNAVELRPYVIVDLAAAAAVDSLGLNTLVRGRNAARRNGGELLLVGPSRFLQTVLRTMRLHTAFRIFDTVPQALTATQPAVPRQVTGAPGLRRSA